MDAPQSHAGTLPQLWVATGAAYDGGTNRQKIRVEPLEDDMQSLFGSRREYLHGPWWVVALVLAFAAFDKVREVFALNLGAFPMWLKELYIRVLVFEFDSIGSMASVERAWNRRQRRSFFYGLSQRARMAYYGTRLWMAGKPMSMQGAAPTIRGSRSGLFWQHVPGGLPVIVDRKFFSGNVFFVDSNTAVGGTTAGFGLHPDKAFTDIEAAIDSPVYADQGDVVFVLPGHAETVADEITVDVAGVTIVGLGEGLARPTLTQNVAGDAIALDADSCVVSNLYFNEATTAPGAGGAAIDVNAAHCKVIGCHFDLGADDLEAITVTATGDFAEIANNSFVVTANGPDAGIEIEAIVTDLWIHHNWFQGGSDTNAWDVGGINSGVAHTQCLVEHNRFVFGPAIIFSAAATGLIAHNLMGEGTLGSMLDPGSCMCFENYEADAVDETARLFPTGAAS